MASSATPTPRVSPGNPGDISTFAINFEKGEESWDEQIDLTELLLAALQERDIPATRDEAWLRTGDGFWLLPQLVSAQLSEDGNMRTSTTIQAWHPSWRRKACSNTSTRSATKTPSARSAGASRNGPRRTRWRCATAPATNPTVPA
ncbi:hypothetical protein WJ968_18255 [Achromobacter xylosoxidans]